MDDDAAMTALPDGDSPSALRRTISLATGLGAAGLRASRAQAGAAVDMGRAVELQTRRRVGDAAGHVGLAALDAVLASRFTDEAVQRVLRSPAAGRAIVGALGAPMAEQALTTALSGPLVDALARDVARYAVVERVTGEILAGEALDHLTTTLLDGDALEKVFERIEPELERLVGRAIESQGMQRLVMGAAESPATERLVAGVIESRLLDQAISRLLESEELWLLVEEIARSPAVTEAITQQSLGFADQVGDDVRRRSDNADAWLERAARRVLHPRRYGDGATGSTDDAAAP
jgi:hypothetical protein